MKPKSAVYGTGAVAKSTTGIPETETFKGEVRYEAIHSPDI